jgi:hypothetical protein
VDIVCLSHVQQGKGNSSTRSNVSLVIYPSLEPPSTKLLTFLSMGPTEHGYIARCDYYESGRYS